MKGNISWGKQFRQETSLSRSGNHLPSWRSQPGQKQHRQRLWPQRCNPSPAGWWKETSCSRWSWGMQLLLHVAEHQCHQFWCLRVHHADSQASCRQLNCRQYQKSCRCCQGIQQLQWSCLGGSSSSCNFHAKMIMLKLFTLWCLILMMCTRMGSYSQDPVNPCFGISGIP